MLAYGCKPVAEVSAGTSATGEHAVKTQTGVASTDLVDSLEERVTASYDRVRNLTKKLDGEMQTWQGKRRIWRIWKKNTGS